MDRATQLALNALNRRFYASVAPAWIESRQTVWPGFARVLAHVATRSAERQAQPLRVLDVGCGDGRFGAQLRQHWPQPLDYLGLDACDELLAHARARELGPQFRFEQRDFIDLPPSAAWPAGEFDLIALLAVLHHVPGTATRHALLRQLGARLASGGTLAITFWHLPDDPRFASRVVPWKRLSERERASIPDDQLEPGDTLLRFGTDPSTPPRYCHFPSREQIEALLADSGLTALERFRADGRGEQLNEYVLLESP